MVKYKDYYQTLGVSRSATDKEIKAAYRKLAREHHPDANAGNKAAEDKFKELAEAYEVLKDPDKRRRYDTLGANYKAGSDFTPPPGFGNFNFDFSGFGDLGKASPFSDFFEALFGQTFGPGTAGEGGARAGGGRPGRGLDQEADIELSMEEVAKGTTRNIHIQAPGSKPKTLQVKIPAGVRAGSKVRVPGEAGPNPMGGPAGDLFLKVKIKAHPLFSLEGENLVSELQISPAQAVIGGEATVKTLDGPVKINIPPLSQNGKLLRLRERGLPKLKQQNRGDHLVRLKITMPADITPEERQLYEKLFELEKAKTEGEATAS